MRNVCRGLGAAAVAGALGACTPLGSRQIPTDRFDYNTAIATSANEQMLLNLVRLRFGEVPTFLAVGSVLTQYVWTGEVGVAGAYGDSLGFPAWTVGGNANVRYIERPTVTYTPLSGQEFAAQLLNPVRADVVFSLVSSGWPPDQLLSITIQRINDVRNIAFAGAAGAEHEEHAAFDRVVDLIIELAKRDSIELVRSATPEGEDLFLEFPAAPDAQTSVLIRELKDAVGLSADHSRFRVTRRIVGRAPDEVTIRMHSLLELMGLLSAGVMRPTAEPDAGGDLGSPEGRPTGRPLIVRSQRDRPTDAFVAVRYDGGWFYVGRSDDESKRAFGLLIYLFQMQASQNAGAGPLLTVPIG